MNDIKLIAMDLDGTSLQGDRRSFSPRLHAALEAAHRQGVAVVPVTGRQYGLLPPAVLQPALWHGLTVLCNGGQVRELDGGRLLYGLNMCPDSLIQLHALAARFDLPLELSIDSHLHLTRDTYRRELPMEYLHFHVHTILARNGIIVESLLPLCEGTAVEKALLPHVPPDRRLQVEHALKDIAVSAVWSSATSMEITHAEATKGNGLTQLSRLLAVPKERMMAIGDSGNDISMLRQAGLGVAMGNAPQEVMAAADVTTDTNENDGAAAAIERYVLGME